MFRMLGGNRGALVIVVVAGEAVCQPSDGVVMPSRQSFGRIATSQGEDQDSLLSPNEN
jgi:hypothetical protein